MVDIKAQKVTHSRWKLWCWGPTSLALPQDLVPGGPVPGQSHRREP